MDQGLVAVTNLAISVLVSRSGGIASLGVLALLTVTIFACTGLLRTLVLDPWLAERLDADSTLMPGSAVTLVVLGAVAAGIATGAVALVSTGELLTSAAGGAVAAAALLQDAGRSAAYKYQESERALASDFLVLAVLVAVVTATSRLGRLSLDVVLLAWLSGLLIGSSATAPRAARAVGISAAVAWWRARCRRLALPLLGDSAGFFLCANVTTYLLAYYASSVEVGAVRVITSLYSPVAVLFTGLSMWMLPTLASLDAAAFARVQRRAVWALSGIALAGAAVMVVWGGPLARLVFGESADPTRGALLLGALTAWSNAIGTVLLAAVKVLGNYAPVARTRLLAGVLSVAVMPLWSLTWGVGGYLTLVLVQSLAVLVIAERQSRVGRVQHHFPAAPLPT